MDEPTNYTEFSSTIIDLIMVSNIHSVYLSGVGEPFLTQDIIYYCPTYCIFKFKKDISRPFIRKKWLYAKGDYDKFRQIVNDYDWASTYDEDVNLYATNFTNSLLNMAEKCIPSKTVTVRPQNLPWMNNNLRKLMRKRNRLFKKYKKDKSVET